jgi:hypothetical protein
MNIACSLLCSWESTTDPYFDPAEYTVYLCIFFLIFTSVFSCLHLYVQCGVLPLGFGLKFYVIFPSHPFSCYMFCLSQPWYLMTSMTNEAPDCVFSIYIPSLKFRNLQPFIFKLPQSVLPPLWSECLSFTPT